MSLGSLLGIDAWHQASSLLKERGLSDDDGLPTMTRVKIGFLRKAYDDDGAKEPTTGAYWDRDDVNTVAKAYLDKGGDYTGGIGVVGLIAENTIGGAEAVVDKTKGIATSLTGAVQGGAETLKRASESSTWLYVGLGILAVAAVAWLVGGVAGIARTVKP